MSVSFVAIDFETANPARDSACAVGLVRVERGQIVEQVHRLIRPRGRLFSFSGIHGITWKDVAAEPAEAPRVLRRLGWLSHAAFANIL